MPKKMLVALLLSAAAGCGDSGDASVAADVVRRYTCFGGDYIVTVYDDITMSATCRTAGVTTQISAEYEGADVSQAVCVIAGTKYRLLLPIGSQNEVETNALIRFADCDVYDRHADGN